MLPPWEFQDPSCKEIGTDIFFPVEYEGNFRSTRKEDPDNLAMIKSLCGQCVDRKDCLEWALHNERFGIWAGFTPFELNRIRKQRNIVIKEEDIA